MKLFLTVVLASVLMLKTAEALAAICQPNTANTCPSGAECTGADGAKTCTCMTNYKQPNPSDGTCRKINGQGCSAAADCASGVCDSAAMKCGKGKGATCTVNADCAALKCFKNTKCADAGAAGVVASVLLMVVTLMTSRIL